ncbi:hypothetical protein CTA1_10059 [Colletotrichum tanaceti]|uniref:Uncharacterized protein n=1 Tax=Colletotrichum tanaceti TaxID=1306861 RepID=A0A4U6X9E1_9PEZI|nr:hypothetical protein CTA1_10059 [Colletotrichum tanaceti]
MLQVSLASPIRGSVSGNRSPSRLSTSRWRGKAPGIV